MEQLDAIGKDIRTLLNISHEIKNTLKQHCAACAHSCGRMIASSDTDKPAKSPLMTAKDVQNLFGIVHSTYYRWIDRGWLEPQIIGGKHYYDPEEMQRKLEGRRYRQRGGMEA